MCQDDDLDNKNQRNPFFVLFFARITEDTESVDIHVIKLWLLYAVLYSLEGNTRLSLHPVVNSGVMLTLCVTAQQCDIFIPY